MTFLEKIFPFLNPEAFSNDNILTTGWIILLLLIFIISIIYIIIRLRFIKSAIGSDKFKEAKEFEGLWMAYQSSFSKINEENKTNEHAEEYFNEHNILYASLNFRLVNNISNILVGLGILGTFVGLTYGISDSDFSTTDLIKESINNLLSGMGTAFTTSIWGMGLSLIYTFVYKMKQTLISRRIQALCFRLDKEFLIKTDDYRLARLVDQKKLLNEVLEFYFVDETEHGKQLPKNVFRSLLNESQSQTTSLQSFSDDLGDSISLAMEKLVEENNAQISLLIEDKLIPVLEDLKAIKQDSGTQVIENAIDNLSNSMKNMMEDFKSTITGDTKEELTNLTERLVTVSESLTGIPKTMDNITEQISEVITSLKETVIANIETSNKESEQRNKENVKLFEKANEDYRDTVEGIQVNFEEILQVQHRNIEQSSELTKKINTILQENSEVNGQFEIIIDKSKEVANIIENVSHKLNSNSATLNNISNSLNNSMAAFTNDLDKYIINNNDLLANHSKVLKETKEVSEAYANRFENIKEGLQGIFNEVQMGLTEYQTTTTESLSNYLETFTTALTKSHQGLEGIVMKLNESTEELFEEVDKINR